MNVEINKQEDDTYYGGGLPDNYHDDRYAEEPDSWT